MKTFTIDSANEVRAYASSNEAVVPSGGARFASEKELAKVALPWPGKRFVEVWNGLPGIARVRRFTDRKTAIRRIWKSVQDLEPTIGRAAAPKEFGQVEPMERAYMFTIGHEPTKTGRVVALLKRPAGATLKAIMGVTGWQPHSVRGFISGQLSKRRGFHIQSFKRDGERVYRIRA